VSVVDTKAKKYLGEIEIPGCGLIFPSAGNRFSSLCSDGTLLTATFDDKLKTKLSRVGPFIDVVNDPVYEHAAMDKQKGKVHFLSYEGMVYSADLSQEKPTISPGWSLLTDADKAESWRPGGWQVVNMHRPTGKLYVLMHKGARWTHKTPGEEVWVFDIATKKRVNRIHLKEHAISIALSQDDDPHLYTQTETATLITYDALSGKEVGEMKFGITPYLLFTHGD
jgi:methylamine dehydrogenase heavy chain